VCLCLTGWGGELCNECAAGFAGGQCEACASGYIGPGCLACPSGEFAGLCEGVGECLLSGRAPVCDCLLGRSGDA
jgi:hypothetical protein